VARSSREKGKRGEREVAEILRDFGFRAHRDGRLDEDVVHDVEGYHFEAKRRETLALPAWRRQAEADAGRRVPVVATRRNREPWYADLPLERLVRLLAIERDARALVDLIRGPSDGADLAAAVTRLDRVLDR
jgi:hypothetical protein